MKKLVRITTVPISLEHLLEGQLNFMKYYYNVTAVSGDKQGLEDYGSKYGVNTFHVEMTREITPKKDFKALLKLYFYFKKEKPFIVHTHTPKAGITGMLAAKMAGVPIRLHTVAGMPLMEEKGAKRKVLEVVEQMTYACATKIFTNSKGLMDFILNENFVRPKKIKMIGKGSSNGIDTSYFDPERFSMIFKKDFKLKLGIPGEDFVFIFVGRLVKDKGINELVAAFQNLKVRKLNTTLLLVGPFEQELNPLDEKTMDLIRTHPKIISVGYQIDVRPFYAVSDVLCFPSYREGFPNVVMQAGAMEIPSIVTDINGCNEIIIEGSNGTIIPVRDIEALGVAMEKMVRNEGWRKQLKQNSRQMIANNFERGKIWKLILEEYKTLEKTIERNKPSSLV